MQRRKAAARFPKFFQALSETLARDLIYLLWSPIMSSALDSSYRNVSLDNACQVLGDSHCKEFIAKTLSKAGHEKPPF